MGDPRGRGRFDGYSFQARAAEEIQPFDINISTFHRRYEYWMYHTHNSFAARRCLDNENHNC